MLLELLASDEPHYVSRGGVKLHHALKHVQLQVSNKRCVDLGQSTGGFTDCLLKNGAASVVGIDVGKDQLHPALRQNPSVLALEGINLYKADLIQLTEHIRKVKAEFLPFEVAVADLSFISLRKVLPRIATFLPGNCEALLLVKPQFEVGPEHIGKNGLVKNPDQLLEQLEIDIKQCCAFSNLDVRDFFPCELKGGDGNQEYFVHAVKHSTAADNTHCEPT